MTYHHTDMDGDTLAITTTSRYGHPAISLRTTRADGKGSAAIHIYADQTEDLITGIRDTTRQATTTTRPGSTTEQIPAEILTLIPARPYLSTACDTAHLLAEATADHPDRTAELNPQRDRLHQRCRLNQKFTGQLCVCYCHTHTGAPTP